MSNWSSACQFSQVWHLSHSTGYRFCHFNFFTSPSLDGGCYAIYTVQKGKISPPMNKFSTVCFLKFSQIFQNLRIHPVGRDVKDHSVQTSTEGSTPNQVFLSTRSTCYLNTPPKTVNVPLPWERHSNV